MQITRNEFLSTEYKREMKHARILSESTDTEDETAALLIVVGSVVLGIATLFMVVYCCVTRGFKIQRIV